MRFPPILSLCGLSLLLTLPVLADPSLHVVTTQPQTPLTQALADLAKQSGTAILTDNTVTASLPATTLQADNVGAMLTKLGTSVPGLSWRKVYLPKDAPLPTGQALSQEVRALQAITPLSLIVASPTDRLTFMHTFAADAAAPASMQAVYLVTDNAVPSTPAAPAAPPAAPAATPIEQTTNGMQTVADAFSKMTPAEQSQALPAMFQQFQRIMQTMDPAVRQQLNNQLQQQWQQGGNGQPGAGP